MYGLSPMDVSARRLLVLVEGLPDDSLTFGPGLWGSNTELAAIQVEMLDAVVRGIKALGGAKRLGKPLRLPRPNDPKPKKRKVSEAYLDLARSLRR